MFNWYMTQNPDVALNKFHPVRHWVKYGRFEGRTLFKPFWFYRKITKSSELLSELLELNEITFGHLDQLIGAIKENKSSSSILVYRIHNYSRQTRKLIFTLIALGLIGNSLELICLNKKMIFFRRLTKICSNIFYNKSFTYFMRDYDTIKKEVDILVLRTLLTNKSEINILDLGNSSLDPRIKSLLGKENRLPIHNKVQ